MNSVDQDLIDFSPLILAVRERWRTFLLCLFGVLAAGAGIAFLSQKLFRAEVTVVSVDARSLPGGLSQLSGLASLAGVNLARGDALQPVAVLKSRALVREFIREENLLPILFSAEWDPLEKRWRGGRTAVPTLDDGVNLFDESIREIIDDKKNGTVIIRVTWVDPDLAAQWANALVSRANNRLREQALRDAERNVSYLKREIIEAGMVSLQQSLGQVLESEMQKLLLARGNAEYAFRVVDPATPPNRHYRPLRSVILIVSLFFGLCIGLVGAYLRQRFSNVSAH